MARPLPVVPRSCSLDEAGLAAQAARYRRAIGWSPEERRLSFGVASASDAPALGAIAFALGL